MKDSRLGVFAGMLGLFGVTVTLLPRWLIGRGIDSGVPEWAPQFGTAGSTVVVYGYLTRFIAPLLILGLAVGVGYYVGTRVDLRSEYRGLTAIVAGGTGIGVILAWGIYSWDVVTATLDGSTVIILGSLLGAFLVEVALVTTTGVLAGATLATSGGGDGSGAIPTTDTDGETPTPTSGPETANH